MDIEQEYYLHDEYDPQDFYEEERDYYYESNPPDSYETPSTSTPETSEAHEESANFLEWETSW